METIKPHPTFFSFKKSVHLDVCHIIKEKHIAGLCIFRPPHEDFALQNIWYSTEHTPSGIFTF